MFLQLTLDEAEVVQHFMIQTTPADFSESRLVTDFRVVIALLIQLSMAYLFLLLCFYFLSTGYTFYPVVLPEKYSHCVFAEYYR